MNDILFHREDFVFSYRVAGILVQNGKVLLQRPDDSAAYAFPGGHVGFGETNAETLIREFKEEVSAEIEVLEFKWVEENFFRWGDKLCHQISLSHLVKLKDTAQIPPDGRFISKEDDEDDNKAIYFYWIPLDEVKNINVYPQNAAELLLCLNEGVKYFTYREVT
jgi:ADP-ribose pyrophosphatase YjhB (NUDIX family)